MSSDSGASPLWNAQISDSINALVIQSYYQDIVITDISYTYVRFKNLI